MVENKLPFNRALLWILVSILGISGSAFMGWQYYLHIRERRLHDDQYRIAAIVQSTPLADSLKSVYLAELLDLSLDHPINLYQFSAKEAERKLLVCPLIKKATVKKILPGTIFIQYQMRIPIACIGDFSNTALDSEGYLFPYQPFFTPKRLPLLYLGLNKKDVKWGSCLKEHPSTQLALGVLEELKRFCHDSFMIKQLDVSQVFSDSYGKRQLIVILEELGEDWHQTSAQNKLFFLRLNLDHYKQGLMNFRTLHASLARQKKDLESKQTVAHSQTYVIDLRIPHLAFIKRDS